MLQTDGAEVPAASLTNTMLRERSQTHERPAARCTMTRNAYAEALTASVMVFGGGALGR